MAAILGNSTAVVVRTRPQALPLAMMIMRKSIHGFFFLSCMSMGLRLAGHRAAGNLALTLSLLSLLGRKTLVAAGHVTTQNLGGKKKICWAGGVAECFDCCCGKLCRAQNLEQWLTELSALSGFKWNFGVEERYIICAVSKILQTFVHKEIRQPNGAQTFRHTYRIENVPQFCKLIKVEPAVDQSLETRR